MKATIRDAYGDPVRVTVGGHDAPRRVYLDVIAGERVADASLTPGQARRIAAALVRAAEEAEAR